ncbi:MAG: sulfite exporter TauE/SafE family protein, partial [Thermofilum sp.]|nr:sulfite exporter TauE/SafE family protein [Thermofilum sp.]
MCIAPYFYINVYVLEKVYSCFTSDISLIQVFLALLSGGIVGFSLGLIGGGGSIPAVPLLIYLVGYSDPHGAIGTTALAVGINALLNIIPHALKRHVNFRLGVIFSSTGVIGVYLGSELGLMTEGRRLLFLFSLLMIIVAIDMLRSKKENFSKGFQVAKNSFLKLAGAGLGVGFLSGFFGIGGGFLIVPALTTFSNIDIVQAIGTSQIAVSSFGFLTAIKYLLKGYVNITFALLYVVGGIIGGWAGTYFMSMIPQSTLKKIYAVIIFLVALYMLYMNIG